MLKKEELIFVKSRLSFWEKLSDVETSILENNITKVTYSKGYNLHSTDSKCLGVLIVQSGALRVYILSEDGREITL